MALSKKSKEEELPFPIEGVDDSEQISFDDLEFEGEVLSDEELEELNTPTVYYTISGKEQQYKPEWDKMSIIDLDIGDEFEGEPEVTIFKKNDKSYDALRLRLLDDGEILDCYFNFPKKAYPYIKNINKGFDFYRTCFDFVFSILKLRDERNVVDKNGDEVNRFKTVNLETFAKYVDSMERIGVRVSEGNPDSEYNSWEIYKME